MASSYDQDDEITGINVTPLVDVMLVLLIIFMVTANYIADQTIKLQLPTAETGEAGESSSSENMLFSLDEESQLYLDGKPVGFNDLDALIRVAKAKASPNGLHVALSADVKTPHGAVVKLIDSLRKNGITEFDINTREAL